MAAPIAKELQNILQEVIAICDTEKIPISHRIHIRYGNLKNEVASCRAHLFAPFRITVNAGFHEFDRTALREIVAHEVVHTAPLCARHSIEWSAYMRRLEKYGIFDREIRLCHGRYIVTDAISVYPPEPSISW